MPSLNKFIERLRYYCEEASVGYDWGRRWDLWDGGDTDCSALTIGCLKEAGFDTGSASYTGNLSDQLTQRGWVRLPCVISQARPGDILLNDIHHVATVVEGEGWNALIAQASIGETGDVYDNQPGDQTGWETNVSPIYDYPWNCILRYEGETDEEGDDITMSALDEPYESPTGDGTVGSVKDRIAYMDMRIRDMSVTNAALVEAVKTLAEAKGADADKIAKSVDKAVKARLEKIQLNVSAS